jgi:hypothetical protein
MLREEGALCCAAERGILKRAEMAVPVAELFRQVGIGYQTPNRWKKQDKGLKTDQVRQLNSCMRRECRAEPGREYNERCPHKSVASPCLKRLNGGETDHSIRCVLLRVVTA